MRWFESSHPSQDKKDPPERAFFVFRTIDRRMRAWRALPPSNPRAMSVNSLHVTSGYSVIYTWKKAGLLGTHLAWRDVLHEGPVPAGLSLEDLSRVRADYLASRGYASGIKIHRDFEKRDAAIRRAREYEEIVLWFEHDLYDQLHILQVLVVLAEMGLGAGTVQIVQSDQYLGMLSPDELLALYPKRRFVSTATADAAQAAWNAFCAERPEQLEAHAAKPCPGLPFMRDGLRRLLEEYPAHDTGLSRTQKQLLQACAQGARRREDVFRRAQAQEEAVFLGDTGAYAELDALSAPPEPLLAVDDGGYDVTVLGRRVLAGDADWLEVQPLDRWIGGVHLTTASHWRWDDREQRLVERVAQSR